MTARRAGRALLIVVAVRLRETNHHCSPHALRPWPMFATCAATLRSPAVCVHTLISSANYAGLFAYLAGASFVLIGVLGDRVTAFGLCLSRTVVGYIPGTKLCPQLLPLHGLQPTLQPGAAIQSAAGALVSAVAT